jgi:hypothetical protein
MGKFSISEYNRNLSDHTRALTHLQFIVAFNILLAMILASFSIYFLVKKGNVSFIKQQPSKDKQVPYKTLGVAMLVISLVYAALFVLYYFLAKKYNWVAQSWIVWWIFGGLK